MYDHLPDAMTRKFGLGQSPEKRSRFFKKVAEACETHGECAFRLVKTVSAESDGKNNPGRWFCTAVLRRLREQNLWVMDNSLDPPKKAVTR